MHEPDLSGTAFDLTVLSEWLDSSPVEMRLRVARLADTVQNSLVAAERALRASPHQLEAMQVAAHRIAGALGYLGADRAADLARDLEECTGGEQARAVAAQLRTLCTETLDDLASRGWATTVAAS